MKKMFKVGLFVLAAMMLLSVPSFASWGGWGTNGFSTASSWQVQKANTFDFAGHNVGIEFDRSYGTQEGSVSTIGGTAGTSQYQGFGTQHGDYHATPHSVVWSYGEEGQYQASEAHVSGFGGANFVTHQSQMGGSLSLSYNYDRSMVSVIGGAQSQEMSGSSCCGGNASAEQGIMRSESFGNYQESRNGWTYQSGSLYQVSEQWGTTHNRGRSYSGEVTQIAIGGTYTNYGHAAANIHYSRGEMGQMASTSVSGYNTGASASQVITNSYETVSGNANSVIHTYGSGTTYTSVVNVRP